MKAVLKRIWKHILVWGIVSILFGILSFVWPGLTLNSLVYLFAFSVIAQGLVVISGAWQAKGEDKNWWVMLLLGIVNVIAGLLCFANPGITAMFFVTLIGISWLITGVMQIYAAISLRKEISNEGWLALAGLLSVFAGLFLIFRPGEGALAMIWLIATYAIIFGIILVLLATKAKNWVINQREKRG